MSARDNKPPRIGREETFDRLFRSSHNRLLSEQVVEVMFLGDCETVPVPDVDRVCRTQYGYNPLDLDAAQQHLDVGEEFLLHVLSCYRTPELVDIGATANYAAQLSHPIYLLKASASFTDIQDGLFHIRDQLERGSASVLEVMQFLVQERGTAPHFKQMDMAIDGIFSRDENAAIDRECFEQFGESTEGYVAYSRDVVFRSGPFRDRVVQKMSGYRGTSMRVYPFSLGPGRTGYFCMYLADDMGRIDYDRMSLELVMNIPRTVRNERIARNW